MIHTVIFDLGGTLSDSPDFWKRLADEAPRGKKAIAEELQAEFERLYHRKDFSTVKDMLKIIVNSVSKRHDLGSMRKNILKIHKENYLTDATLFDDTIPVLQYLKDKGVSMVLASDGDSYIIRPQLRKLGIRKYFNMIFISSEIKSYKTTPATAKIVKPYLKKPYKDILFVGDRACDMETARRMGVRAVHIRRTSEIFKADHVIRRLTDLVPIVNASPSSRAD